MRARTFMNSFLPGAGALFAGACAQFVWQDAAVSVLAASVGAVAGGLMGRDGHEQMNPGAAATPRPHDRPARPASPGKSQQDAAVQALLEAMPLSVLVIDTARQIAFANPGAGELFGIRSANLPVHVSALRSPLLLQKIERCFGSGEGSRGELALARKNDLHLIAHVHRLNTGALRRGGPDAVLVAIEDLTAVRQAREMHRDFVANASHELKTPLASISVLLETLQGHAKDDAIAQERFLSMMAAQSDRMKRLIEDLLSLNRIELNVRIAPRHAQPLGLIVGEITDALTPIAEESGVRLECCDQHAFPEVLGDREELAQCFRNLIDNAIKYGHHGGFVRVETTTSPARPGMIGIAISDDGPGIAREHIPRLTERFYRVSVSRSRERGGTGLGLAIVKHIITRHRGDLDIESEFGKGSRFTVWLPVLARASESGIRVRSVTDPMDGIDISAR